MFGLRHRDIEILKKHLLAIDELEEAWIFGSRAMGNYKPGSDIDIAIKGKAIPRSKVLHLIDVLNEEEPIPYFIDIIDFDTINNPHLKEHIRTKGLTIVQR